MPYTRRVCTLTRSSQAVSSPSRHRSTRMASASRVLPPQRLSVAEREFAQSHLAGLTATCAAAPMSSLSDGCVWSGGMFHRPRFLLPPYRTRFYHKKFAESQELTQFYLRP